MPGSRPGILWRGWHPTRYLRYHHGLVPNQQPGKHRMNSNTRPLKGLLFSTFLLPLLISNTLTAQEQVSRHYDWLTADKVSGSHVLQIKPDGTRVADFEFNDRGRGPKLHEELKTGEAGLLTSLQVSGHSYMGAPAEETFAVKDGVANWNSTLESGEAKAAGYYWANDGTPEQGAHMARALLANPNGQLDLLPSGQASIHKLADKTISHEGKQHIVVAVRDEWIQFYAGVHLAG